VSNVLVKSKKLRSLNLAFYIVGGITLLFSIGLAFPIINTIVDWYNAIPFIHEILPYATYLDYVGLQDASLAKNGWPVDALQFDREKLLSSDAWRSFIFVVLTFGTLWFFLKNNLKSKYVVLIIGFLIISDMWTVNKRYLNDDNFSRKKRVETPYQPSQADIQILKDKDPNFRVFNQSVSTFNDASTSYFHKSIGGYHGAKLKRYQELIENHISKGNMSVLNMLNTKYFISSRGEVQINQSALGNCWFVSNVDIVENADQEISSLSNFNPSKTAIVDSRFSKQINDSLFLKEGSSIVLTDYKPNHLTYSSNTVNSSIAIFSEIYYDKGWNAYIDGKITSHFRANYVLRGMNVPSGKHIIEFKFEPQSYKTGELIAMSSSIILLLLLFLISFRELQYK
jgi:hypothetical protein